MTIVYSTDYSRKKKKKKHLNKQRQNKISEPIVSHVFDVFILVHAEHDYLWSSGEF